MGLSFFGLTSNNPDQSSIKLQIYKQIHQICFYGKGGYSWSIVYNMPIYLRRFVFNEIKQFYEEEKAANEKAHKSASSTVKSSPRNNHSSEKQTFNLGSPVKGKPPVSYQ